MAIDLASIGTSLPLQQISWNEDTAMLYALAVGAGGTDPLAELDHTTENSGGLRLKALPSLPCALASRLRYPSYGSVSRHSILHAGQNMVFHTPFPNSGTVDVLTSIIDIKPSRDAALVTLGAKFIASNGMPLTDVESVLLIRGEPIPLPMGKSVPHQWMRPSLEPETVITERTQPNQALLYRLLGDRNPLHSDPAFAHKAGQPKPILHGLCTLGYAIRALLKANDNTAENWSTLSVRFSAPVTPGDELTSDIWRQSDGMLFETKACGSTVLKGGKLSFR